MKLKVCFCNKTVLRTDITRFIPVWGSYCLALAMLVLLQFRRGGDDSAQAAVVYAFARLCTMGVAINGIYALIVVQALFGDLLTPRLCNSLHAMPVTRDGFYGAHLAAGLLFALVPNCLVLLPTAAILGGQLAPAALLTLLGLSLQYVFYLGTALVAVQLAGNRIGMVLIYGIINFATVLLYWFVAMVFVPLIYGKDISVSWMARICPTVSMFNTEYFSSLDTTDIIGGNYFYHFEGVQIGNQWQRPAVCAGLGILCMAVAQVLYRRRRLETAGDLVAFRILSPAFLALYTLTVAAFLHVAVRRMTQGAVSEYFFLPLGLIVGYITGLMLLRRTSRVFRWRMLVPLGGILAVCGLCVLSIATDVFHVIRHVPKAETVQSVTLMPIQKTYADASLTLTEDDDIANVIAYHQGALQDWQGEVVSSLLQKEDHWSPGDYLNIQLRYTMKNGATLQRRYYLDPENPAYDRLRPYLSSPELSLGMDEAHFRAALASATEGSAYFYAVDGASADTSRNKTFDDFSGLANAVLADCKEGSLMSLNVHTREGSEVTDPDSTLRGWLSIVYRENGSVNSLTDENYLYIDLNGNCTHTLFWISTHGVASAAVG